MPTKRTSTNGVSVAAWLIVLPALGGTPAVAQDISPDRGRLVYSLGMPPVWKGDAGATIGAHDPGADGRLNMLLSMGLRRDLGSPVVGLAGVGLAPIRMRYLAKAWRSSGPALDQAARCPRRSVCTTPNWTAPFPLRPRAASCRVGLCEWIEDQADLDALLPPPSGATRRLANLMKLML